MLRDILPRPPKLNMCNFLVKAVTLTYFCLGVGGGGWSGKVHAILEFRTTRAYTNENWADFVN